MKKSKIKRETSAERHARFARQDDATLRWSASERLKRVQATAPRVAWRIAPRNIQAGIQLDLLGV